MNTYFVHSSLRRSLALATLWLCTVALSHAREIGLAKLAVPTDGDGVVIASLSVSGSDVMSFATFKLLEAEGDFKIDQFTLGRPAFSIDETLSGSDGRWGRVIAIKLKPGKYRFASVNAAIIEGHGGSIRNTHDLNRVFGVEANKVLYLGNLDVLLEKDPAQGKAGAVIGVLLLGVAAYESPGFSHVRDTLARDLKVIEKFQPTLAAASIETRLMRDKRDETLEQTVSEVKAQAAQGQAWAKAALAEATLFGVARLPDFRHLRLPASLGFNNEALEAAVVGAGDPSLIELAHRWGTAESPRMTLRTPFAITPELQKTMILQAANRYGLAGVETLLSTESLGIDSDPTLKAVWKERRQALTKHARLSHSDLLAQVVDKDTSQKLADSKAKIKMVATTPSGRSMLWEGDGSEPVRPALQTLLKNCQEATQEVCWIMHADPHERPPVCSAVMQATGLASHYPDARLPRATAQNLTGQPWAAAYQAWQNEGADAAIHPRALVWDVGLAKAFTAAGDCLSAYRAMHKCKTGGGRQCQLVLQDDALVPNPAQ